MGLDYRFSGRMWIDMNNVKQVSSTPSPNCLHLDTIERVCKEVLRIVLRISVGVMVAVKEVLGNVLRQLGLGLGDVLRDMAD